MKLELKTENDNSLKIFLDFFKTSFILALFVIFCDAALKLGIISRHYQIDYNCRLLAFEKSSSNFKKLSKLSNLKNKQKIWEFCRDVIK